MDVQQIIARNPGAFAPITNRYIPIRPSTKQMAFLLLPNLEAFYGG